MNRLAVCVPYKAGSETWRYLLRSLSNETNIDDDNVHSWDEIKDYEHVIQVRDPYERLLSAYRFTFQKSSARLGDSNKLNEKLLAAYPSIQHEVVKQSYYYTSKTYGQS